MSSKHTCMAFIIFITACGSRPEPPPTTDPQKRSQPPPYEEIDDGLNFTYRNGGEGNFYLPEIIGAGGAFFDYDNDGDLDLYLPQGYALDGEPVSGNRFYRNRLIHGEVSSQQVQFEDVTEENGFSGTGYGMGACTGDFNNDGHMDLYVTHFGDNILYQNLGDGTFRDVTAAAGANDPHWSVSASFLDFDADGHLDLFISNYTDFTLETHVPCFGPNPVYCHPLNYGAVADRLLRNNGDGTFEDMSESSGITATYGRALGVAAADFTGDGRVDIYVANDGSVNQFWVNLGDGTFEDRALLAGCGLNASGMPEAGMGVDAADFDGDGDQDLFITHLMGETNTLYVNDGTGNFEDQTPMRGLAAPSHPFTGFGTAWTDFNNDGVLDLLAVNGSVSPIDAYGDDPFPYHQTNQLFQGLGDGRFREVDGGAPFQRSEVSRGAVFGDVDNDGDEDVLVVNNQGPARLLANRAADGQAWLGLRLMEHGRDALGASAGLVQNGTTFWRRVRTDGGYASARDPRIIFGGISQKPENIRVIWSDGKTEQFPGVDPGVYTILRRGEGTAAKP